MNDELRVVAVTDGPGAVDLTEEASQVHFAPQQMLVRLEVSVAAPGAAWRMDRDFPPGTEGFVWDLTYLRQWAKLHPQVPLGDLGLVARVGPSPTRSMYVPVRLGNSGSAPKTYRVALVTATDLTKVITTVILVTKQDQRKVVWQNRREAGNEFPRNRPFHFDIAHEGLAPGVLEIGVRAAKRGGGIVPGKLELLHL